MAGSSVDIGAVHPGRHELRQRMLVERAHRAGPDVRDRADVEDELAVAQLVDERRVLDRADPVAQPVGAERVERAADRRRARDLAGMWHRREPLGSRARSNTGAYGSGG